MKKLTLLTVLLAVVSSLSAQYAVIKGKCKIDNWNKVVLYSVVNGQLSEHSSTTLDDNAGFAFMFCPQKEGFYYLGDKDKKTTHRIYITTGGDEVNIEIEPDTYTLTGSNSEENKVLSAWTKLSYDVRFKSLKFWKTQSYYKDFFPELDKLAEQAKDFKVKTNNKFFNKLMKKTIDWDVEYYALNLLVTPRQKHPAKEDYTDYYNNIIKNKKFDSDLLLYNDYAMKYIDAYNMYRVISGKDVVDRTKPYDPFSNVKNISDKTLQGEFILHHCNRLKTLSEFFDVRDRYGKYLANDEQKERFHLIELPLRKYGEGEPAIDFTYQDINGKMVSLSDFKGKLVLVDVWATWCGPCKQQLPYMNKLEEEYEGKDIVFVSVSVDEKKDKWMKMVKDKNLGGVQLWAEGWDTSITRDYNIQGIPRFMLFDKEGKIINTKCPRPSQPELKELIDSKL